MMTLEEAVRWCAENLAEVGFGKAITVEVPLGTCFGSERSDVTQAFERVITQSDEIEPEGVPLAFDDAQPGLKVSWVDFDYPPRRTGTVEYRGVGKYKSIVIGLRGDNGIRREYTRRDWETPHVRLLYDGVPLTFEDATLGQCIQWSDGNKQFSGRVNYIKQLPTFRVVGIEPDGQGNGMEWTRGQWDARHVTIRKA